MGSNLDRHGICSARPACIRINQCRSGLGVGVTHARINAPRGGSTAAVKPRWAEPSERLLERSQGGRLSVSVETVAVRELVSSRVACGEETGEGFEEVIPGLRMLEVGESGSDLWLRLWSARMDLERDRETLSTRGIGRGTRGSLNFGASRAAHSISVRRLSGTPGSLTSFRSRVEDGSCGRADARTYVGLGYGWVGRL